MRGKLLVLTVVLAAQTAVAGQAPTLSRPSAGVVEALTRGEVVGKVKPLDPNWKSLKYVQVARLRAKDGTIAKGIFKPIDLERRDLHGVIGGKLGPREVAASDVAREMGVGSVPFTTMRTLGGRTGSLQLFVPGGEAFPKSGGVLAVPTWDVTYHEPSLQLLRAFDYVIGNLDRRAANVVPYRQGKLVVPGGIDNGYSLPVGDVRPYGQNQLILEWSQAHGALDPGVRRKILATDPLRVARALAKNGIERPAAVLALRRLARLQGNPDLLATLETPPRDRPGLIVFAYNKFHDPTQELDAGTLARVDAVVAAAYRGL